jgi:hypothetical protein
MILSLLACISGPPSQKVDPGPFYDADPVITSVDFECSEADSAWTFIVRTEGWTGGGWVWMGKTPDNAEGHRITSVSAAADGSSDKLKLTLDIAADWRDATRSKSTRWLCSDLDTLSFMTTAYDPHGDGVVDCRAWGASPRLWLEIDAAYDCETVIQFESDTGR